MTENIKQDPDPSDPLRSEKKSNPDPHQDGLDPQHLTEVNHPSLGGIFDLEKASFPSLDCISDLRVGS
jgi:hypothetical protein